MDSKRDKKPLLVAITGPSGSGKSHLATATANSLEHIRIAVSILQLDRYYRDLSENNPELRGLSNFDHPDALELSLFKRHLGKIAVGRSVKIPRYNFTLHKRHKKLERFEPMDVVLLEGLHLMYDHTLRKNYDFCIYLDTTEETCLKRRIFRDIKIRGRSESSVRRQYEKWTRPMGEIYVKPLKSIADLVINGENSIQESIRRVQKEIKLKLEERNFLGR